VCENLSRSHISAVAIHGNKSQSRRQSALQGFQEGRHRVLVATDIAARGLDVEDISHVFNYDIPEISETYVHRIGRTARAGAAGAAISFCSVEELSDLTFIERLIRRKLPTIDAHALLESSEPIRLDTPPPPRQEEKKETDGNRNAHHENRELVHENKKRENMWGRRR
jgi:ATP-dependent RNA helicase RhlE